MLLKIIGSDAIFDLYDGVFLIGSDEDDDIYLKDLAKHHARFVFIGDQVILQSASALIYVNGQPVTQFPCDVEAQAVVSMADTTHIYFAKDEDEPEPSIPTLQVPTSTSGPSHHFLPPINRQVLPAILAVVILVITMFSFILFGGSKSNVVAQETNIVLVSESITPDKAREYITAVFGKYLLAYKETEDVIAIRVLEGTDIQMERWHEDMARLAPKIDKDIQMTIVSPRELTSKVKRQIEAISARLRVNTSHLEVTVTGACLPAQCQQYREKIQQIKEEDVTIHTDLHEVKEPIRILSTTVSKHASQAVIENKGMVQVIPEGGKVFDIGYLRLISQEGIEVSTSHGTIFFPWRKS